MGEVLEEIDFVARSDNRFRVLKELYTEGSLHRDELRDRVDGSRTTIQRNLDLLIEKDWIRNTNREYQLTSSGKLVAEGFTELADTMTAATQLRPFLKWVSMDEFTCDLRLLADAELLVAESGDPWAMINRHVRKLRSMDHGWFLLPFTGMHATETASERIIHHGARCELVVEPSVADTFKSNPNYASLIEEASATGRSDIFKYDGEIPFALGSIDGVVQIIVAEGDDPRAMLETENEKVYEWAEGVYENYKHEAEKIT